MPDKFHIFAAAVRKRFDSMAKDKLFVVDADRDRIWEMYLSSFPEGSNPIFRERTEHDCSCCRHFIRDTGNVVAIQNGKISTIWDLNALPHPYQDVADGMSAYIKSLAIRDVFLSPFSSHGTPISRELIDGRVHQWTHFSVDVPREFVSRDCVSQRGAIRTTFSVLLRGLTELKAEALETVADLIRQNAIYRGEEFSRQVAAFRQLQARLDGVKSQGEKELIVWPMIDSPVSRFRNTVIGTLVQDLSDGVDLEVAVRSYESKVAPQNYKRPTALITKTMVENAMKTIKDLDLEPALERRHARLSDVSVNSVLFVDNAVQGEMKDGLKDLLMKEVKPAAFKKDNAEEISVDAFMKDVLPRTSGLQLYLDNALQGNFVSMTAPVHENTQRLFRWSNDFAWSYDGNVTDTIKDKVKRAGGQVENVALRVSLAWWNYDDLDLHAIEPNGNHIYYCNKSNKLDVDMNAGGGQTREPVENIRWGNMPPDGAYKIYVHQFCKRESTDGGFTVEIESPYGFETLTFEKSVQSNASRNVALILIKDGRPTIQPDPSMKAGSASIEKWGLKTLDLVRVNSVVISPNHWDGNEAGNKHWFFILEGCKNPLPTRGIYNEFLHPKLETHRKVFEVLGDKTKCQPSDDQLSGVGFSSTRKDKVTVLATGPNLNKAYTITFGKD